MYNWESLSEDDLRMALGNKKFMEKLLAAANHRVKTHLSRSEIFNKRDDESAWFKEIKKSQNYTVITKAVESIWSLLR